jgi:integrase
MAKPQRIKNKDGTVSYRIFVNKTVDGRKIRESKSFSTRQLAIDWAEKRAKEIERAAVHGEISNERISDIIERYQAQFSHNYGRSKNYDINRLMNYPIAELPVSKLTAKAIIAHCTERNKEAKPQTVANDVIWLRTILHTMAAVDGFDYDEAIFERASEVLRKEKLIGRSKERNRRPTRAELWKLSRYFYKRRSSIPMLEIMWFAIYSARRLSEITRLEWIDNNNEKLTGMVRDAKDPRNKKGNNKRFKYSKSAWKIVCRQPRSSALIFPFNPKTVSAYFQDACAMLDIHDLHFHDLRHEATSRLFEAGYSIEQVQLFTLHEDWKTLARYTHLRAEDID